MKTSLVLNIIAVGVVVISGITFALSIRGNSDLPRSVIYILLYGFPVLLILGITLSHLTSGKNATIWAIIPILYSVLIFIALPLLQNVFSNYYVSLAEENEKNIPGFLNTLSKDYMCPAFSDAKRQDFITRDTENDTLVYLTSGYGYIRASKLGKINGDHLDMFYNYEPFASASDEVDAVTALKTYHQLFDHCRDSHGKNIFDRYTVAYVPHQDVEQYKTKKYDSFRDGKQLGIDTTAGPYETYRLDYKGILVTGLEKNKTQ